MFYWLLINEEAEESGGSTKYHDIFYCNDYIDDSCDHQAYECSDKIPAPTVGEMLPEFPKGTIFRSEITPDEMAENLCDLLENNLVKLEEKE